MSPVLVVARLTLREASRRWIVAACTAIAVFLVVLSAWGFDHLAHDQTMTSGEINLAVPQSLILFMFMFSFVVALSASAMASPAVSADVESGVLYTIVARPVRRSEILVGKWLGLMAVLFAYAVVVSAAELGVVDAVSGFLPPGPVAVVLYLFAEGAILLTLTLAISTRLSAIATGVVAIALFGSAWLAGVVGSLGAAFNVSAMVSVGRVARYLLPTDGLWHGAIYYLEPHSFVAQRLAESTEARDNPFFSTAPPSATYLVWAAVWFLAVLVTGLVSFQRREL
ncbi:MAG TPA: ABC transporter permease [Acidimicrobiales bacterium]|nr:ABC transporter permease [Acidimicrobiales bacterium]